VGVEVLGLMMEYCRFHLAIGRSDKERKLFDEKFLRLDTRRLCELTSGADSLELKPLVDLTSRALARKIEGKTPEEIRQTFHLPDDLTGIIFIIIRLRMTQLGKCAQPYNNFVFIGRS
jgi:S-phase kinase-associated protein 1